MSGLKSFAVAGAGVIGAFIVEALLNLQKEGKVSSVIFLSRKVSAYSMDNNLPIATVNRTPDMMNWSLKGPNAS